MGRVSGSFKIKGAYSGQGVMDKSAVTKKSGYIFILLKIGFIKNYRKL